MIPMTLVVVGKDQTSLDSFLGAHKPGVLRHAGQYIFVSNTAAESLATIGNRYLVDGIQPVLGLCHADCSFGFNSLVFFYKCAMAGNVCGIAGRDMGKGNRWCCNKVDTPGLIVASLRPGPVSTLDSNSVFFRRDLGLRFDEATFDGFHCHVEDLCLKAHAKGIPVVVPAADANHLGESTLDPEWQKQYWIYRERLAMKWKGTTFETT